jgi:hypothetical protein
MHQAGKKLRQSRFSGMTAGFTTDLLLMPQPASAKPNSISHTLTSGNRRITPVTSSARCATLFSWGDDPAVPHRYLLGNAQCLPWVNLVGVPEQQLVRLGPTMPWTVQISIHEDLIRCIKGALWGRQLFFSRLFPVGRRMFNFGIDLTPDQDEEPTDIHPREQHNDSPNAAVGGVIGPELIDVKGEP